MKIHNISDKIAKSHKAWIGSNPAIKMQSYTQTLMLILM